MKHATATLNFLLDLVPTGMGSVNVRITTLARNVTNAIRAIMDFQFAKVWK